MGVMSCSRSGCENIMCHTHIPTIGYICNECQGEFKDHISENNVTNFSSENLIPLLKAFMETERLYIGDKMEYRSVSDFFADYTPDDY